MAASASTLATFGAHLLSPASSLARPVRVVPTGFLDVDSVLPDGGFPRGAIVELTAFNGLGLATSLALAACVSAQVEARSRGGESAWCAFLDPTRSLHGPGAQSLGVDLRRLLVVQPPSNTLARIAVRIVTSRVFSVVVIDTGGVP